jgi:hypothetical protein
MLDVVKGDISVELNMKTFRARDSILRHLQNTGCCVVTVARLRPEIATRSETNHEVHSSRNGSVQAACWAVSVPD